MEDKPSGVSNRADFIRDMFHVYWANMARSMEGVWKVLAPVTVAGTILAGVHKDYLPGPLGISIAFIVIFWALNVTIDLNAWHRRNLFFASKAEQVFLTQDDYGKLLPGKYKTPKAGWITFYRINVAAFILFLIITVVYGVLWELPDRECVDRWALPAAVLVVCVIFTLLNFRAQERSAQSHFDELFPKKEKQAARIDERREEVDIG